MALYGIVKSSGPLEKAFISFILYNNRMPFVE